MSARIVPAIGLAIGAIAAGMVYALAELIAHFGEVSAFIEKALA